MTPTDQRLREIAERENKATKGPWELLHASVIDPEYTDGWIVNRDGCGSLFVQEAQDSAFIAHSRQDVPWLLALIKKQREALERIAAQRENRYESTVGVVCRIAQDALNFSPENL